MNRSKKNQPTYFLTNRDKFKYLLLELCLAIAASTAILIIFLSSLFACILDPYGSEFFIPNWILFLISIICCYITKTILIEQYSIIDSIPVYEYNEALFKGFKNN